MPDKINIKHRYKDREKASAAFENKDFRAELCNVECECGSLQFMINWIDAPYTGGYLKITCMDCGENTTILDDYS